MKIQIFSYSRSDESLELFQDRVNAFILGKDVIDLKQSESTSKEDGWSFTLTIIYR